MPVAPHIDSNDVAFTFALEDSPKVLPVTPVWRGLKINGYPDFGGAVKLVSREPIDPTRMSEKGTVVDRDASGGISVDFTYEDSQEILPGFLVAALRTKDELDVAVIDGAGEAFQPVTGGASYQAGDLLLCKESSDAGNNGLHVVSGVPVAANIPVTSDLVTTAADTAIISRVGYQFGAAELTVDVSGTYPRLVSSGRDCTTLGILPGEVFYLGGDAAAEQFADAENHGWVRARSVAAAYIELDKTEFTMVVDAAGTGKTIRLFFGRVLKNETGALIEKKTYQLERKLGAADTAIPANIQSQYVKGAAPNELTLTIPTADKITMDLAFVALDQETRDGATGVKTGTRPTVRSEDAFNTSSDIALIKLAVVTAGDANPTALLGYFSDVKLSLNNNISANKGVGVTGGFSVTYGGLKVGVDLDAYFADVAAVEAINANSDLTLGVCVAKDNQGFAIDIPLLTGGDGRPDVQKDQPIKIPLSGEANNGSKVLATMDHALLMVFFDYLPDLAAA